MPTPIEVPNETTPDAVAMVLHKLRSIPEAARLSGVSKTVLYNWAGDGRLQVKLLGTKSRPAMRTTLAWVQAAIDKLPNL